MPRKKRKIAKSGIYHAMIRGVNKQDIFVDEADFKRMMHIIQNAPYKKDRKGNIVSSDRCTIYAYCILGNHIHLLVKEGENNISTIMQRIGIAYANYYNLKNRRVGHLSQGRFTSEPIDDDNRFKVCFRYIHRNPVKAQEAATPEAYPYCSWNEYDPHKSNLMKVLTPESMKYIYTWFTQKELVDYINTPNDDKCLDIDDFDNVRTDSEAWDILSTISEIKNLEEFRKLDPQIQLFHLFQALEQGIKRSQAARLSSLSLFQIEKAINRKNQGIKDLLGRKKRAQKPKQPIVGESNDDKLKRGSGTDNSLSQPIVGESNDKDIARANATEATSQTLAATEPTTPTASEELHNRIRQIPSLNRNTYHLLHLTIDYLYRHPESKCADVACHLNVCNEAARKHLIRLSNEHLVEISGNGKNRTYKLFD